MEEEYQDIVDEDDNIVSSDKRQNIWDKGLESRTRSVNLFIIDENQNILLPVRSKNKKKWPLCYDFSCGENVISGETYEQAILRGIKEELGINNLIPIEISYLTPKIGATNFLKIYKISVKSNEFKPKITDHKEIDHFEWKTIEDIRKLMYSKPNRFKNGYQFVFEKSF